MNVGFRIMFSVVNVVPAAAAAWPAAHAPMAPPTATAADWMRSWHQGCPLIRAIGRLQVATEFDQR